MWGRATGLSMLVLAAIAVAAAPANAQDRYALANGCYTVSGLEQQGPLRFQATDLGRYLLYTRDGRYVTHAGAAAADASPDAVWIVGEGLTLEGRPATFTPAQGCAIYPEVSTNVSGAPSTGVTPYAKTRGLL